MIFRVVFSLIPSHLFLPPVCPLLYIGSLSSLCQLLLYNTNNSLQTIADTLSLNPIKVRKLLITAGVYESEIADAVNSAFEEKQGMESRW